MDSWRPELPVLGHGGGGPKMGVTPKLDKVGDWHRGVNTLRGGRGEKEAASQNFGAGALLVG